MGPLQQADSQQVNLAAYQAFAMQQRALLQQALTYESYLQKAAAGGVGGGGGAAAAAAQFFQHSQQAAMGGAGPPRPPDGGPPPHAASSSSPRRSPLKLEQVSEFSGERLERLIWCRLKPLTSLSR